MQGWMLSYKNPDPYRMFSRSYTKEATAYKDAAGDIEKWAKEALEETDGDERAADVESLRSVLYWISENKYKEAYSEWRSYAVDNEPREDVIIEETEIVDE